MKKWLLPIIIASVVAVSSACDQQALAPPDLVNPSVVSGRSEWSIVHSFPVQRTFQSVWGAATGEVFVGYPLATFYGKEGRSAILRRNLDGTWTDTGYEGNVLDIWGTSRDNVYAAEENSLRHLKGGEWVEEDVSVSRFFGIAEDDIFGIGPKGVYHFDGRYWDLVYPMQWGGDAVWVSPDRDLFVAQGLTVTVIADPRPVDYELNGWPEDIWGPGADDVWVVGGDMNSPPRALVLHFDGAEWTTASVPGGVGELSAVWGRAADDIYAVGRGGAVLHYDGGGWRLVPRITHRNLYDVWGSDVDHVYAVGGENKVIQYDGSNWTSIKGDSPWKSIGPLWVKDGDEFAVADDRTLFTFKDAQWREAVLPPGERMVSIWGTATDDMFVAVVSGKVLHHDGETWTEEYTPTEARYFAEIRGQNNGDMVVVGPEHVVERVAGVWRDVAFTRSLPLRLWVDPVTGDAVAVGNNRYVLVRRSGNWTEVAAPPGTLFNAAWESFLVWGSSINDVYMLARDDIYRFDGNRITHTNAPHAAEITRLTGSNGRVICTAGKIEIHRVGGEWRTYETQVDGGAAWPMASTASNTYQLVGQRLYEWGGISED